MFRRAQKGKAGVLAGATRTTSASLTSALITTRSSAAIFTITGACCEETTVCPSLVTTATTVPVAAR
ncbi:MAG: hypothetical protein HZT43_00040 [Exiguobacterium profundum]|nr:MAG: hypothetical protein HZT43_00040 [Exiguobacterium profundum]